MTGRLERKLALITGATSSIGNSTASLLAGEGAAVVLTGIFLLVDRGSTAT